MPSGLVFSKSKNIVAISMNDSSGFISRAALTQALFLFLLNFLFTDVSLHAQYDPNAAEPIGKLKGTLLLHGGGAMSSETRKLFVMLAGDSDAKLVIIPSASAEIDSEEQTVSAWKDLPHSSIKMLHITDRSQASQQQWLDLLNSATGVWINGGDQERLENLYAGTPIEDAIGSVVERGGIVGGSSAGAAIATKVMISRGAQRTGFDLLPGAIVDQHFLKRNREERLLRILDANPGLFGAGIDEGTSLIVRGRKMTVFGESSVTLYLAGNANRPLKKETLKNRDVADLIAWHRAAVARKENDFPKAPAPTPVVPNGSLVIVGGGGLPEGLLTQFIELAGGPEAPIVYLPCIEEEESSGDRFPDIIRSAGAKNVTMLHTKDRNKADKDEAFLSVLKEAKGIWFGGGRQWNLVDSYQNTTSHEIMHQVLAKGGVIGGSSAGASIQGDYMPRGDPMGNLNIIAEGYERGLGFLCGVAIDQHFAQRRRFKDMSLLVKTYPQLLGIGIDEGTAIVVKQSVAEVVGKGNVAFYDALSQGHSAENEQVADPDTKPSQEGNQETAEGSKQEYPSQDKDYVSLPAGGRYDLKDRKVLTQP
jgi:cyanophycinase